MAQQHALVTGGAGFIGSNVVTRLVAAGWHVTVLDDLSREGAADRAGRLAHVCGRQLNLMASSITDGRAVAQAVRGMSRVYHLAAQVAVTTSLDAPRRDFDVNAGGTITLLEALRTGGERPAVIFTSTNKVYGELQDVMLERRPDGYTPSQSDELRAFGISEARPLAFHSPYGCSKGAADQYVLEYARAYRLPAVVFRMSCIYGPHQRGTEDQGWVAHLARLARNGQRVTVYGDGYQVRDLLYVDDLVQAMDAAQAHLPIVAGRAFNIGGGPANQVSVMRVLELLEGFVGRRVHVDLDDWRSADQRYYVSDHRAFTRATGWAPRTDVPTGLASLLAWLDTDEAAAPVAASAANTGLPARSA